jgi:hypothetical protein
MIERPEIERTLAESGELLHRLDIVLAELFRTMRASNDVLAASLGVTRHRRAPLRPATPAGEAPTAACPAPPGDAAASPAVGASLPTGGGGLEG